MEKAKVPYSHGPLTVLLYDAQIYQAPNWDEIGGGGMANRERERKKGEVEETESVAGIGCRAAKSTTSHWTEGADISSAYVGE